jgi:CubicO group peptidase (beta-lactamase class C family)
LKRINYIIFLSLFICFVLANKSSASTDYSQNNQTIDGKISSAISKYIENNVFSGSILVAKKGKIIYHKGVGFSHNNFEIPSNKTRQVNNTPDTHYGIGSISKTITAVLIMQLVEQGKLKLTDSIGQYLPKLSKVKGESITIHHLLSHRSGLPNYFEIPGWTTGAFDKSLSLDEFNQVIYQLPLKFAPGSDYEYSNSGYFLLGRIIEAVTKKPYSLVLQQQILVPAKMQNTGVQLNRAIPNNLATSYQFSATNGMQEKQINIELFRAAGDLYSTSADIFRFEQALYDETLLTKESKSILFNKDRSYGWNQFSVELDGQMRNLFSYSGQLLGFNAILTRIPSDKVTVILLGNIATSYHERMNITGEILNEIYQVEQPESKLRASLRLHRALVEGDLSTVIERIKNNNQLFLLDPQGIQSLAQQIGWSGLEQQKKAILTLLE